MLTKQVVLVTGERITEVGPEGQVKIPPGAQVIDLSQATVAARPDRHALAHLQQPSSEHDERTVGAHRDPQRAGRSAGRLHGHARHGIARQRIRRRRHPQRHQLGRHRRSAASGGGPRHRVGRRSRRTRRRRRTRSPASSIRSAEEARAAVREHVERGVDWIKLYPTGGYSFSPTGEAQYVADLSAARAAGARRRDASSRQEGRLPRLRRRGSAEQHHRRLRLGRARLRPDPAAARHDGAETARLRSDARPLHRAVHGRQRREEHRRQVPDDSDLRQGRGDGRRHEGAEDHGRQRRRRIDVSRTARRRSTSRRSSSARA